MTGYNYWVEVDPDTSLTEPLVEEHGLKPGIITNVHIDFPYGCNRYVWVQLWVGERPLVPDDKGEWVRGNGQLYNYNMDFKVQPQYGNLKIIVASPGAVLKHFIGVGLGHVGYPGIDPLIPKLDRLNTNIEGLSVVMKRYGQTQTSLLDKISGVLFGGRH